MIKKNASKTTTKKTSKKEKKQIIAVIGAGKIGEAIISGLLGENIKGRDEIIATVASRERAEYMTKKFGMKCTNSNIEAIKKADVIMLAVKPQIIAAVLSEIAPALTNEKLLISVAAGVSCFYIESFLKEKAAVVRAMPNLCCQVYAGMTAISKGSAATAEQVEIAKKIFEPVSRTIVIDEKHLDAVTGLSGSGPAYIYIAIEALAEGGVKVGLPREVATLLAAQATLGAAKMVLETHSHPALLKEMVTTPAGVTIDGIMELEEGKFRVTLIKAVMKGTERSKELVKH